jgi:site-specific DNA-methyltransferase (adenine-specific)
LRDFQPIRKEMMMLIFGDCLEELPKLQSQSIDMVMTDPPYGTTACKWDSIIPLKPMWEQLKRVIKPNGAIVMTASQPFTTTLIASNMKMFRYSLVWEKNRPTGFLNAKRMPLRSHEDISVFYKALPTYNPQMTIGLPSHSRGNVTKAKNNCYGEFDVTHQGNSIGNEKYPRSVLQFDRVHPPIHPTQKPVALMEYLIKTYTNEGETVLDFAMGSGTTGVACSNLGRKFIGIEKDEKYFKIAENRINAPSLFT